MVWQAAGHAKGHAVAGHGFGACVTLPDLRAGLAADKDFDRAAGGGGPASPWMDEDA
jgi:hypothetical protein